MTKKRSSYTPIKWSKKDNEEFARLKRNAKAKLNRIKKNSNVDLTKPEMVEKHDINMRILNVTKQQPEIKTRKQFNKWKEDVQWFNNRANTETQFKKNKYGVVKNVKKIKLTEKKTKQAQKVAKEINKKAQNLPFISGDTQYGTVGDRSQLIGEKRTGLAEVPADFNFDAMQTEKRFDKKLENMTERADPLHLEKRNARARDNFAKLMEANFNSHADELVKDILNLSPKDFQEIYLIFDEVDFSLYGSDGVAIGEDEEATGKVMKLRSQIAKYKNEEINFDLRNF